MKLLDSYKKMLEMIRDSDFKMKSLEVDKTYKYGEYEKNVSAGSSIWDCDDDTMAKILFMQSKVDQAYKGGIITLNDIVKAVFDVFEDKGTTREEKKADEQAKLNFNR